MGIDESITVVPYDDQWADVFKNEKTTLLNIFGTDAVEIEHFGSTSVRGMVAKPIIDILIGVSSLELDESILHQLQQRNYENFGEAGVEGRLYFRKRAEHSFNLAVVIFQGEQWVNNIQIRDYLRTHPQVAEQYSMHKRESIQKGITTLLAYSDEKAEFVQSVLRQAKKYSMEN